ncbi:CBS domain-containing protein [Halalkalibacter krulwichiae]|uniref:Inosine 5'-monophosphate dehydrogenase n=1 Tax=Halalkalibacter krulwichiae TaxID=199441 RepID=A0A1X9MFB4_9BACI|nr:CBS domain-containing protein [Halalkalibacter krulwichiae]ARK31334.1 inosine 5'-monophosphate dehydrogenase [Halalkalibacter krulwichiae]
MSTVGKCYRKLTKEPITVHSKELIVNVQNKLINKDPIHRSVYVLDKQKKLIGIITLNELMKIIAVRKEITTPKAMSINRLFTFISEDTKAEDIMCSPISVRLTDRLEEALELMLIHDLQELPVVDETNSVIGDLNVFELLREINDKILN